MKAREEKGDVWWDYFKIVKHEEWIRVFLFRLSIVHPDAFMSQGWNICHEEENQ